MAAIGDSNRHKAMIQEFWCCMLHLARPNSLDSTYPGSRPTGAHQRELNSFLRHLVTKSINAFFAAIVYAGAADYLGVASLSSVRGRSGGRPSA